jgi:transcription initiation factor TFIID subunit 12
MATNEAAPAVPNPANIITALTSVFKSPNGESLAQLLEQNMGQLGELMRQGKLTAVQIQQVRRILKEVRFLYLTGAYYL